MESAWARASATRHRRSLMRVKCRRVASPLTQFKDALVSSADDRCVRPLPTHEECHHEDADPDRDRHAVARRAAAGDHGTGQEARGRDRQARDAAGGRLPGWRLAAGRRADVPEHEPEGAADDGGRVRQRAQDLFRALRRLPRRAAQGRDRQAADARHHAGQGHRLPEGLHRLRLAGRHAELADLGRDGREDRRPDGALHPARRRRCRRSSAWRR